MFARFTNACFKGSTIAIALGILLSIWSNFIYDPYITSDVSKYSKSVTLEFVKLTWFILIEEPVVPAYKILINGEPSNIRLSATIFSRFKVCVD
jgi:hypothetical protein